MYKHLYSRFINADPERLHFAAHSHHLWPDVTREAHLQYWDDSAKFADQKWDYIFGNVIPEAQRHIADVLGLSDPGQIAFAPNTHEFIVRLLSCFEPGAPLSILTTDGEFHSCKRQLERYKEFASVSVEEVAVEPFDTFEQRFREAAHKKPFDLVFFSQVFFSLGYVIPDIATFSNSLGNNHRIIVVDGYHSFCAIPTNLSAMESNIFFLSGSYKYAQSGEGGCFMHVPKGCTLRPANTGWFADFGSLEQLKEGAKEKVRYAPDGFRFWGATFDPSCMYRLNATMRLLKENSLHTSSIHRYVQMLQQEFLIALDTMGHPSLNRESLVCHSLDLHAHFLTFRTPEAPLLHKQLMEKRVITDIRGDRIRFGFGIYQTSEDVTKLIRILRSL